MAATPYYWRAVTSNAMWPVPFRKRSEAWGSIDRNLSATQLPLSAMRGGAGRRLWLAEESSGRAGTRRTNREKRCMARRLWRQTVTIATGLILTAGMFFGLGLWRRSEDTKWCQQAAAGGVVADDQPLTSDLLDQMRSACTVQRQRQRSMFGAIWRTGGREAAQCGFELARIQLISYQVPNGYRGVLERYGVDDPNFDISNREDQDRFVKACLSSGQHEAG